MPTSPRTLTFDHEPFDEELGVILGPDLASNGVSYMREGQRVTIGPFVFRMMPIVLFMIPFLALLSSLPWLLPALGMRLGVDTASPGFYVVLGAVWLLILPTFLGILMLINGAARRAGPGAILDLEARTLALPYGDMVVPLDEVANFTSVVGRRWYGGKNTQWTQWGALVCSDSKERWVHVPIAKLTGFVKAPELKEFSELCGIRIRRVRVKEFR